MAMPTPNQMYNNKKLTHKQVEKFMNTHGFSQKDFAEFLGVTEQAVKLWTTGQREFSVTNSRLIRTLEKHPRIMKEFQSN